MKDPDSNNFLIATSLLPTEVAFESALLARIPTLKMEDCDLTKQVKFPHLETNQYMYHIYYKDIGVTKLELLK